MFDLLNTSLAVWLELRTDFALVILAGIWAVNSCVIWLLCLSPKQNLFGFLAGGLLGLIVVSIRYLPELYYGSWSLLDSGIVLLFVWGLVFSPAGLLGLIARQCVILTIRKRT